MIFPNPITFITSVLRNLWGKIRGYEMLADEPVVEFRLGECHECEYLEPGPEPQCRVCTCFVDAKAMLNLEQCPKKKWLAIYKKRGT